MSDSEITNGSNSKEIATHVDGTILEGASGGIDDKGVATFTVHYLAKSRATILSVGKDPVLGLVPTSRSWTMLNDGTLGYTVTVVYKGHMPDQEEEGEGGVVGEKWSIDYDHSEEPLEAHPKILEILATYGGTLLEKPFSGVSFEKLMPKTAAGSKSFGKAKKAEEGKKNPMVGVNTYPLRQATVSRSYSTKKLPNAAIRNVDKIVNQIPGAPDGFNELTPDGRNWLTGSPKVSMEGNVWSVTETWKMSPPGGFPEVLFDLIDG